MKTVASNRTREKRSPATGSQSGTVRLTIREVAKIAGVSIATVSRVMKGTPNRVSPQTAERVLAVVERLHYRPSPAGSTLRSGTSRSLAVLVPQISNSLNMAIAKSIETSLRGRGGVMLLCGTDDEPEIQDYYLEEMRAHSVFGIALLGVVQSPGLRALHASGTPIVFVNRRSPLRQSGPFIGIDNFAAAREIGLHFREGDVTDYLIFHTPLSSSAVKDRVNGLVEGMNGIAPRQMIPLHSHTKEEAYAAAIGSLDPSRPPQAIFCSTDEIAYGVSRRCIELDLLPQRDIVMFGFDGNPLNEYIAPWLGTVRVPFEDFGEAICQCFDQLQQPDRQGEPPEILFPYRIVKPGKLAGTHTALAGRGTSIP